MKCLEKNKIILYIDKTLSEKEMKEIDSHLAQCPQCRVTLENMRHNLQRVLREMDMLEPEHVPAADFIPPQKPLKRFRFPNPFDSLELSFILKPSYAALTVLLVFLLVVAIHFSGPGDGNRISPAPEGQFSIQFVKMEEKPARTFIVKEQKTKTTLVWVEKI